jgi:hypothetical protein
MLSETVRRHFGFSCTKPFDNNAQVVENVNSIAVRCVRSSSLRTFSTQLSDSPKLRGTYTWNSHPSGPVEHASSWNDTVLSIALCYLDRLLRIEPTLVRSFSRSRLQRLQTAGVNRYAGRTTGACLALPRLGASGKSPSEPRIAAWSFCWSQRRTEQRYQAELFCRRGLAVLVDPKPQRLNLQVLKRPCRRISTFWNLSSSSSGHLLSVRHLSPHSLLPHSA